MTTLAAWIGVDQRGPSSLYLASDSRLTNFDSKTGVRLGVRTDEAQKVFTCGNQRHLFGYSGCIDFPARAIPKVVRAINERGMLSLAGSIEERQKLVASEFIRILDNGWTKTHLNPTGFSILHAAREGEGMLSIFHLWILGWSPGRGWQIRERAIPQHSELLYAGGSGRDKLMEQEGAWRDSNIGRTSRGVFSAFCEALTHGGDENSGGAPQLGGLFRTGFAREFGVWFDGKLYLEGKRVAVETAVHLPESFNDLFERNDPRSGIWLPKAQRHHRPGRSRQN